MLHKELSHSEIFARNLFGLASQVALLMHEISNLSSAVLILIVGRVPTVLQHPPPSHSVLQKIQFHRMVIIS